MHQKGRSTRRMHQKGRVPAYAPQGQEHPVLHSLCSQRTDNLGGGGGRQELHTKRDKRMTARHKLLQ